jgi:PAS domain S-box-containing protein
MKHHATDNHELNHVSIDDKGRIVAVFRGIQTAETIDKVGQKVESFSQQLRSQGKPVYVLTDVTAIRVSDITSSARGHYRGLLERNVFDKLAIYSKESAITTIAMYTVRLSGVGKRAQFFASRNKAFAWFEQRDKERRSPFASTLAGSLMGIVGLSVLIGWQLDNIYLISWFPQFRPMNPISALGLVAVGVGLIGYGIGRILWLRIAAVFGITIGVCALTSIPIDTLLYGSEVARYGSHGGIADSAAISIIALGVVALLANRKWQYRLVVEAAMMFLVGGLALLNIFGQLYAYDWIYSITPQFVMSFNLAVVFFFTAVMLGLLLAYYRRGTGQLLRVSRTGWLIVIVLVLVQLATYGGWSQASEQNKTQTGTTFRNNASAIENTLQEKFNAYTSALYGFQGLFASSSYVSQGEFSGYYQSTKVATNYPGLRALSFIRKTDTANLPALVQSMKADRSLNPEGNQGFAIINQSNMNQHYIVSYIASSVTTGNIGTDLSDDPDRAQAFQQAEQTGKPIASGTVMFAATATEAQQTGFFITVPVTYEGDANKVVGFVNAVFAYNTFFANTFSSLHQDNLAIKITDLFDGKTVFTSSKEGYKNPAYIYSGTITVANRSWRLDISAPHNFANSEDALPAAVLLGGQAFSLLLIVIFWIQAKGRSQALDLADDITKDLQHERNLAVANNQKSQAILSSIGDGVFAINKHGKILIFNPAAQLISGFNEQEAIGKDYKEVLRFEYEKTGKVNDAFVKKALDGHAASMSNHTVIVRKDKKRIAVADSAAPIRDSAGAIAGAIVVFRDVSKEYELDKAKSEFVSLASHQLRTPLSAINWYGEMLLGGDAGKLTKDQHEYIREIFEGSQRMVELVNSLLDVSRLEVGKLADKPEPTDVASLIESLAKELEVSIVSKHMTLKKDISKLKPVIADPKQLRMIVQNLMSNAVKYTPEKGTVGVVLRPASAEDMNRAGLESSHPHWFLSVADDGFGIPKEEQPKIFGKLFRANNVRKLDVEGTGLGLYIVKQVVEKMGGRVWFESEENKGATFYVVAPVEGRHSRNVNV